MRSAPPRIAVSHWVTRQTVILDWYDGPREGVCALVTPQREFAFSLLAERENEDQLDDRLFLLKDLPVGSVDHLIQKLGELGSPSRPHWVPLWTHDDPQRLRTLDHEIRVILEQASRTIDVVLTRDLQTFSGLWQIGELSSVADWFHALNV